MEACMRDQSLRRLKQAFESRARTGEDDVPVRVVGDIPGI